MKLVICILLFVPGWLATAAAESVPREAMSEGDASSLQFVQVKISEVPEPQTWSTIGIGLAMVGAGLLRKVNKRRKV